MSRGPSISLTLVLFFSHAALADSHNSLIGAWLGPDGATLEFWDDGFYALELPSTGPGTMDYLEVTNGSYQVASPGRMTLTMGGKPQQVTYKIGGSHLVIDFGAHVETYRRSVP